jgi:hypothetical protein
VHTNITALALVLLLAPGISSVSASTITYSFTGTADTVDPLLASAFGIGDTLTGTFEYDPTPRPGGCRDLSRCYPSPLQLLSARLGSYEFSGTAVVTISSTTWGVSAVRAHPFEIVHTDLVGPPVNGLHPRRFGITLAGASEPHDYLQIMEPVFADYSDASFDMWFDEGVEDSSPVFVFGTVTSLAPTAVPEPATAFLLITGVLACALHSRARARNHH